MARTLSEMRSDAEVPGLVRRAQAGEAAAFDELVRTHFTHVYAFLHRQLGNPEDAEDLAQETFVRAHAALAHYRADASFATWLVRIAHHLAIDHQRASGRRHRAQAFSGLDASVLESLRERAELEPTPNERAARGELARALSLALDRLPPRLRAVLVLRVFEEREYDEVARITGVRPATARTQLVQARKLLLRWLAPLLDTEDHA